MQPVAEVAGFADRESCEMLVGVPAGMPRARAGDTMFVEVEGVGRVENPVRCTA